MMHRVPSGPPSAALPVTRRIAGFGTTLAVLALLVGCVAVPTAGPIQKVEGQRPACQNCVSVEVAPPSPGDDPSEIVRGYLRATSNYQPNYSVARRFLTKAAAEAWTPEAEARIYRHRSLAAAGNRVILDAQLVGSLDLHRSYTPQDSPLQVSFRLAQEDGEWRIDEPPGGLLIAESLFNKFYSPYSLHFVSNGHVVLVPDPIYLPNLPSTANIASALIKALLAGPPGWLRPVVMSAIPPSTALSGDAVTITDGVATVPLNDPVLKLNEQQRALMAAQVLYTLQQASIGIRGVLFTVKQQPLLVPGGDEVSFVVPVEAIPRDLDPIPFVAGEQLYGVRNGAVQRIRTDTTPLTVEAVPGPLGKGGSRVDSVAVSFDDTDLAVVSDNKTVLQRTTTASTEESQTLMTGARRLLRPQFSRSGELWAISGPPGSQRISVFIDDKRIDMAAPGLLGGRDVVAFRISPDGARMALIRRVTGGTELGLARINRASDEFTVDGWLPVDTTKGDHQLVRLQDVAWIDGTELMVLGSPSGAPLQAYRISQDGSALAADAESAIPDAMELTVLQRTETSILVDRNGQTYRTLGGQWAPFLEEKLSTIAYPG
jgi:lipoprotein LpqB-like beta-propeller protein/sporulation and spore germination protein